MRPRLTAALGGTLLLIAALTGCATPAAPGDAPSSVPDGGAPPLSDWEVDAAWLNGGSMIALVTYGSSSCVPTLVDAKADAGVLVVELADANANGCTDDLVPRPLAVPVPSGIDASAEVEVQVSMGEAYADVDLDPYTAGPVEEFTPSAGWLDDDAVAILTWGSSSCVPVIEDVSVPSAASVVVRFAKPDLEQVCTMDMAPQLTVAMLPEGADVDDTATLTLGGLVDAEPLPIG
ncbi:hypothetical protein [Microbacterium dauci]|uniref:Lipoprotein n=1 Tax=Microbacterium dauci TaxID=3048008 RepID=A0ABT6ZCG4_9MICO|nr:hypothetical protein [Microbacterium sp. LX3-4]MDJ1113847.1 hypothetical protein [Microbacterium sp. LX3-4]